MEVTANSIQNQNRTLIRLTAAVAACAFALAVSGCNTTEGAGKDIKSLGKGIEESAQDAKD